MKDFASAFLRVVTVSVVVGLTGAIVAQGAEPGGTRARDVEIERLKSRQTAVSARGDLDSATKQRIEGIYARAISELQRAGEMREESGRLRSSLAGSASEIAQLEKLLRAASRRAPPPASADWQGLGGDELQRLANVAQEKRDDAERVLEDAVRDVSQLADRPLEAGRERDAARAEIDRLRAELGAISRADRRSVLGEASRAFGQARIVALEAELDLLDREGAYLPTHLRIAQLKREIARAELAARDDELRKLLDALEAKRSAEAARARDDIERARSAVARQPEVVRAIAAGNGELSAQLARTTGAINEALRETAQISSTAADLESRQRGLEQAAEGRRLGAEFAQTLATRLRELPTPESRSGVRSKRARALDKAADDSVRITKNLLELEDLDQAVQKALLSSGVNPGDAGYAELERTVREQLTARLELLTRLGDEQRVLINILQRASRAEDDLAARVTAARAQMVRQLYWFPLAPVGEGTFRDLKPPLAWLASLDNWRGTVETLKNELMQNPVPPLAAALVAFLLYALRGRIRARLGALSPGAVGVSAYRFTMTLRAILVTLLLAVPAPLALGFTGEMLMQAQGASEFDLALGESLVITARTLLVCLGFSWLFYRQGVAVEHFGWPVEVAIYLSRGIRRLIWSSIPILFAAILLHRGSIVYAETLGRLLFIVLMAVLAFFLHRLLRRSSPPMTALLPPDARGWSIRTHPLWHPLVVLVPAALAAASAAGFFFASVALFALLLKSLLLLFVAAVGFGLTRTWILVQRARLAQRQARESAARKAPAGETVAAPPSAPDLDIAHLGSESRKLLDLLILIALAVGLWLIWRDAVPFLETVWSTPLWTYTEAIDGAQLTRAVTVGSVLLSVALIVVTMVSSRKVGSILDIVFLQQLELQQDATYAIKTVTRYVIVGVGLVLALNLLHVSWNKLQWLVAALGVGLGFGLQEIVANFVSGLIVLGERPIRINDVVTVGDVTGRVSRIRARATVVTDFDNKEVIIPNKAFITERVINWSLSDQVTRVVSSVGVAYGTDPELAQRVILDAVRSVPDVLANPPCAVFFVRFGESSLDFEIRAHVNSIVSRPPALHAINIAVARALRRAGIEIPFPQRDLHIRSVSGPGANEVLAGSNAPAAPDTPGA